MRGEIHGRYYLRLAGLDPNKRYFNEQTGQILSGRTLMNAGICIRERIRDFESRILHLVAPEKQQNYGS
ncbi:MAG: GH36 C-terminal domain-containing protein [Clostridia bacterium]|nr:GH36 C-terminal domain-containing protein [Clostridia bacterium]